MHNDAARKFISSVAGEPAYKGEPRLSKYICAYIFPFAVIQSGRRRKRERERERERERNGDTLPPLAPRVVFWPPRVGPFERERIVSEL